MSLFADDTSRAPPNYTKPGTGVELSETQQAAADRIMKSDRMVTVLTGPAGCGKTTLINYLRSKMAAAVCATTGKAAMHINGCTADALFCFKRGEADRAWQHWCDQSYLQYVMRETPDLIIIDEASMIGRRMGDIIYKTAKDYMKRLLLVGDWGQASPVLDGSILESKILEDYDFIKLTENHRQADSDYLTALNKLRLGQVDDSVRQVFGTRMQEKPPEDDSYLRIIPTNRKANLYNRARLWRLVATNKVRPFHLYAAFKDERPKSKQTQRPYTDDFVETAIDNMNMAHEQPFAVGARVVMTMNQPERQQYVNGDQGEIVAILGRDMKPVDPEALTESAYLLRGIEVRLDRTGKAVFVERVTREVKDNLDRNVLFRVTGFPMQLGYAITIHKSQGMTVDRAWVDLATLRCWPSKTDLHGLAYVALSRTRTLEGLLIGSWDDEVIYVDPQMRVLM